MRAPFLEILIYNLRIYGAIAKLLDKYLTKGGGGPGGGDNKKDATLLGFWFAVSASKYVWEILGFLGEFPIVRARTRGVRGRPRIRTKQAILPSRASAIILGFRVQRLRFRGLGFGQSISMRA